MVLTNRIRIFIIIGVFALIIGLSIYVWKNNPGKITLKKSSTKSGESSFSGKIVARPIKETATPKVKVTKKS